MTHDFSSQDIARNYRRFWKTVAVRGEDECWPVHEGHETFRATAGRSYLTISAQTACLWLAGKGALHDGVLCTCGNPRCCNPRHLEAEPLQEGEVVLGTEEGYTPEAKSKTLPGEELDAFARALIPLTEGKIVLMSMDAPRLQVVKRIRKQTARLVVLTPGPAMGAKRNVVLVSIVGSGSALVRIEKPAKVANLVLAGMPAKLANALMDTIHRVFQEI